MQGVGRPFEGREDAEAVECLALTVARWQTVAGSAPIVTNSQSEADSHSLQPLILAANRAAQYLRQVDLISSSPDANQDIPCGDLL